MTKKEIIKELKTMFISKFGNKEVELSVQIPIEHDIEYGTAFLQKIRYNEETKTFEWYKDYFDYGWKTTQTPINDHAITIFSNALGVKVATKTDYIIC
jgi:hypothetical protein